ncbi:uncharacterized protein G2W53_040172 [Senna tora]|uniref:Uncharacterized protein n=1 Tax=Senna tora TaxID=362788 RepID=A0A834W6V1_9FABA|nr:uncharacterized protein G2W53_040172 [Senna tora]
MSPIRALKPLGFLNATRSDRKSTRIPKYTRSDLFDSCNNTFKLVHLSSFEIQSRFSNHNVFRLHLTNLPCDHEPDSEHYIRSDSQIQREATDELTHHPCDHVPYSTIKSTRIPKYNANRSV